jgi:aspartate ammonia-lyase
MRLEKDSMGKRGVPDDAYYGVQTMRALDNFPVSGRRERPELVRAYAMIKFAAARTNVRLGVLDGFKGKAIERAAKRVMDGDLADQFPVDVFQAGAGTSFNMNVNEVIANVALETLGRKKGDYAFISPNDHVNRGQSTNDTFPTASHIAAAWMAGILIVRLSEVEKILIRKSNAFQSVTKSGRTHLMDALPVTMGQEFHAYAGAISASKRRLEQRCDDLMPVPLGGTAVGTGMNAHPEFASMTIDELARISKLPLTEMSDKPLGLQSRSPLMGVSGALRELAVEIGRIANDLRLMASGPTTGLGEIILPEVQPGSSIMPGKSNPVMVECLNMICYEVIGNDLAIAMASQAGQLELNVMTPLITHKVLDSLSLLNNYLPSFEKRCLRGIIANEERSSMWLDRNPILITHLTPRIGYLEAAEIAKEAMSGGRSVVDIIVDRKLMSRREAEEALDANRMLAPGSVREKSRKGRKK